MPTSTRDRITVPSPPKAGRLVKQHQIVDLGFIFEPGSHPLTMLRIKNLAIPARGIAKFLCGTPYETDYELFINFGLIGENKLKF